MAGLAAFGFTGGRGSSGKKSSPPPGAAAAAGKGQPADARKRRAASPCRQSGMYLEELKLQCTAEGDVTFTDEHHQKVTLWGAQFKSCLAEGKLPWQCFFKTGDFTKGVWKSNWMMGHEHFKRFHHQPLVRWTGRRDAAAQVEPSQSSLVCVPPLHARLPRPPGPYPRVVRGDRLRMRDRRSQVWGTH